MGTGETLGSTWFPIFMSIRINKIDPKDGPIYYCALSGRPTPKKDMVYQNGHWVRKEYADNTKLKRGGKNNECSK